MKFSGFLTKLSHISPKHTSLFVDDLLIQESCKTVLATKLLVFVNETILISASLLLLLRSECSGLGDLG